ncbi:MAG: MOSC domain-containing protein [Acidimicrobiales bacterium]
MSIVAELRRFPVKSFQTAPVPWVDLGGGGIVGDRVLGLREVGTDRVLSAKAPRIGETLLGFSAEFDTDPEPGQPLPGVSLEIDGETISSTDPAAVAAAASLALGLDVELVTAGATPMTYASEWPDIGEGFALSGIELDLPAAMAERGSFADLEPLHVLTTASIAHIQMQLPDSIVNADRFRPSLLIDAGDAEGMIENDWEGRTATVGDATIRFGSTAPRCVMTTRAQLGMPRDKAVLQTIAATNKRPFGGFGDFPSLGIYAEVVEPGRVETGDPITFL